MDIGARGGRARASNGGGAIGRMRPGPHVYSRRMPKIATADRVGRDQLMDFVRTRHRVSLVTTRRDGRPQISPVTAGVDSDQRIVVSTYPDRAKAMNLRRNPAVFRPGPLR